MKYSILILSIILMVSCVPLKQYQDLKDKNDAEKTELRSLRQDNERLSVESREAQGDAERLQKLVAQLEQDTIRLAKENWNLKRRNDELSNQYKEYLESLQGQSGTKSNSDLLAHLQELHEQLQQREDELIKAEKELDAKRKRLEDAKTDLNALNIELESRNKRLFELERALSEKDSLMNALKKTVADALTGFGADELAVHIKNGKVYVSMEEKLLFTSGSYQVSPAGVQALKKISGVLEQKKDINVLVEGHTDNVPYKSAILLDNWDLSVKRATSVIRIMLSGSNIDPSRVTAAGRSEYVPLDSSNTSDARRKNRRTEIILSPNLDQIFDMLQAN